MYIHFDLEYQILSTKDDECSEYSIGYTFTATASCLTLSTNDVDSTAQWYVDYLGFSITDRFSLTRPDGRQIDVIRIARPGLQLNISKFPGSVPPNRSTENQGWRHLAFEVEDVDRTYQQLRSHGVQFITEPFSYNPPGYRVVFFQDLEGNILELYQENL